MFDDIRSFELFALAIPLLAVWYAKYKFPHKIQWWEIGFPFIITLLVLVIFKAIYFNSMIDDKLYKFEHAKSFNYQESYTTWRHKRCTRTVGSKKSRRTVSYDCSYCQTVQPYFFLQTESKQLTANEEVFNLLDSRWGNTTLNETWSGVNTHGNCGSVRRTHHTQWDGSEQKAFVVCYTEDYENKVQASHSVFNLPKVTDEEALTKGLYRLPEINPQLQVNPVLGELGTNAEAINDRWRRFNAVHNQKNGVIFWVLLFDAAKYNKSIVKLQQGYWDGGNCNEVVLCIGHSGDKIVWNKTFSWTDQESLLEKIDDKIAHEKTLDLIKIADISADIIQNKIMAKDFVKDFSYLHIDIPDWAEWTTVILSIIVSGLSVWWCVANSHQNYHLKSENKK